MTWIKCSDRMPSHAAGGTWNIFALVVCDHQPERIRLMSYYTGNQPRWYDEEDNQFHGEVTHWMKLPELPGKP